MDCIVWLLVVAAGLTVMLSMVRWFEQATEAVQNRWWNKTLLLVLFPPSCWFFPSRVSAGRPTPVPLHEPVRGFGSLPKAPPAVPVQEIDQPPPGTPPEFLVKPVPPPRKTPPQGPDPDKIARLRQKMRDQGMLDNDP